MNFRINSEAFDYLIVQRGALDDMKGDPFTWCNKYTEVLNREFSIIADYLPRHCDALLDVGSGLGGIDAMINDHYGGGVHVTLLDGIADPPKVTRHSATFNHMGVAHRFLKENGVAHFEYIDANDAHRTAARQFDLIVSFKSWCFHVEPAKHLDLVMSACIPKRTELIIDVRRDKFEWHEQLASTFRFLGVIHAGPKAMTCHYLAN